MSDQPVLTGNVVEQETQSGSTQRISPIGVVIGMVVLTAIVILFNAFPHKIGIYYFGTERQGFIPLLAPEFQVHLLWLNVWWGLGLALAGWQLVYGHWTPGLRMADLGLSILGLFVLWQLVNGGPLIALDPTWISQQTWSGNALAEARHMVEIGDSILRVILGVSIFGGVIGIIAKLIKLVTTGDY